MKICTNMEATPIPYLKSLHMIEELLQSYIEHHPDGLEKLKPFIKDMQDMIVDFQEITTFLHDKYHQQNEILLSMGVLNN